MPGVFPLYSSGMDVFEIEGGEPLSGEITVSGSKNATTPILAATLLTTQTCVLSNLPLIEDVFRMLEILESMGAEIEWRGKRTIAITNQNIDPEKMDVEKVKQIRSSILLFGSLAARFDSFSLYHPGGCVIGARPVGTHFDALEKLGIRITQQEKSYRVDARDRRVAKVILREMSVTATENAMMLAAGMSGKTTIRIAAAEPHVEDLGRFLVAMGADIKGLGTHTLEITGTGTLAGAEHAIIPDANEAATFLILGAATGSALTVKHAREEHLDIVLEKLREFGADFVIREDEIEIVPGKKLHAIAKLDTRTYPGIPSDVQAPFGVLATQAEGETLIFDTIFEGRFNYVSELEKMVRGRPYSIRTRLSCAVRRSFTERLSRATIFVPECRLLSRLCARRARP